MARSIDELAARAYRVYHPLDVDQDMYRLWIEEGYREFVHECGGVYTDTYEIPLQPDVYEYALPSDPPIRILKPKGVYLYYAPRTISTASRTGNVVTITTATAHNLAAGVTVTIDDVTPVGATDFDGDFVVVSVPTTVTFTYAQTAGADTGTGGTVASANDDDGEIFLSLLAERDIINKDWSTDTDQPSGYAFPDSNHIYLHPTPDGGDPVCVLRYDAEAPVTLTLSTDLPIPDYCEKGLMGYGKWQAALMAGDDRQAQLGLGDYEMMKARYNGGLAKLTQEASRNAETEGVSGDFTEALDNAQKRAMGYEGY